MARIRTIKPEFWSSEQVVELSPTARLLFIGLWNFCDDGGNHPASARTLKMEVFPGDDFTAEQISGMVDEMKKCGLIIEYQADNRTYWHVTGWHHQKIEKPNYKHPAPKFADQSPTVRRPIDPVRESKGKERKGKEGSESNARAHEGGQAEKQKKENTPPPQTSTGGGAGADTPAAIYALIETHVNTDDGLRELVAWKKQAGYSDRIHGPTTGEVTKFISKYLDAIRAGGDPVAYFRDHFAAWLVRATEYNRSKKDRPKYEPPPYTPNRPNGNATAVIAIGDLAGKTLTKIGTDA